MKYYVVTLLTNTAGQDAPSIAVYPALNNALIAWHNKLASFHNAPDVLYAVIEIINEIGNLERIEIVDHRPGPEPEVPEISEEPIE